MEALVCVDVQPDFLPGGPLGVENGQEVIPRLVQAAAGVDMVIASRDWHPQEHVSFVVERNPYEILGLYPSEVDAFLEKGVKVSADNLLALYQLRDFREVVDRRLAGEGIWPAHCVAGTPGAALVPEIDQISDLIVSKGTDINVDAYSAFSGTNLAAMLHAAGVTRLKVGGIATDYCVKATVLDALTAGFEVSVLTIACRAVNLKNGDERAALAEMHDAGATLVV
jgi:nicotinamidase/pyrazinamidase